ncbi:carcinine transporter [Trichonephila clavata]|uniref:Carcinine transporter n=1 Tax=Trichonephila clavata TaxID=2740835 RepID=A0A8X6G2U1_TRICU|nr:carcinine transporter [Trichonephila clavata]
MEFEDILIEVGDYGKYQSNLIMIFLVPAASLLPWFSMNILFMVSVPDHWCHVPELDAFNLSIPQQRYFTSPHDEHCMRYDMNYSEITNIMNYTVSNGTSTKPCDHGWQYDQTYWDATAATKWDMVCDDAHYNSFVLTMYNVGSIIGTPIYGALSDKIGRKITFFITIIITAVTAISSVLMHDFTAFVIIKTINGSLMPCVFQLPYIIILEIVAPEMRTRMNGIVNVSWTIGACILPVLAYYSRTWVTLGLLTSSVTLIFLFYYT